MPSQISNKIEKRKNAVATDRNGSEIRHDDTVREIGGESKQGVIIHIYRSYLFLHNREQTENSGIFVVRATNVATVAAKGGRTQSSNGPDLSKMNPALQRNGANANGAMPPPKSFGRDRALGQTVTIRKGPYKGLLGIVKDTTDLEARVELHTKSKTITVPKDTLGFKDPITGQSIDYSRFSGGRGGAHGGASRGGLGSQTPGRVPDWQSSGATPRGPSGFGGRTPAWGMSGGRTPAWAGAGGAGGRTPSWKQDPSGGRTPAWGGDGRATVNPYADGGRTAYGGAGGVSNHIFIQSKIISNNLLFHSEPQPGILATALRTAVPASPLTPPPSTLLPQETPPLPVPEPTTPQRHPTPSLLARKLPLTEISPAPRPQLIRLLIMRLLLRLQLRQHREDMGDRWTRRLLGRVYRRLIVGSRRPRLGVGMMVLMMGARGMRRGRLVLRTRCRGGTSFAYLGGRGFQFSTAFRRGLPTGLCY